MRPDQASSWQGVGDYEQRSDYSGQAKLTGDLSEKVVDLMLTGPASQVRDATFELMDALTPHAEHVPRSGHVLCQLFEEMALGLQPLIDAPATAIGALVGDRVVGFRLVETAVRVLLQRAVK